MVGGVERDARRSCTKWGARLLPPAGTAVAQAPGSGRGEEPPGSEGRVGEESRPRRTPPTCAPLPHPHLLRAARRDPPSQPRRPGHPPLNLHPSAEPAELCTHIRGWVLLSLETQLTRKKGPREEEEEEGAEAAGRAGGATGLREFGSDAKQSPSPGTRHLPRIRTPRSPRSLEDSAAGDVGALPRCNPPCANPRHGVVG